MWSPLALDRAAEIAAYIAKDDPVAARRWVDGLFDFAESLRTLSERGRIVPEDGRRVCREIFYGRYRVIYRIDPKEVAILTVRHGRQLLNREDLRGGR